MKTHIVYNILLLLQLALAIFALDIQEDAIAECQQKHEVTKTVIRLQTQLIRDQWLTIQQTKHAV